MAERSVRFEDCFGVVRADFLVALGGHAAIEMKEQRGCPARGSGLLGGTWHFPYGDEFGRRSFRRPCQRIDDVDAWRAFRR